ncbi:hypothetical protein [Sphingomonas sp.]
MSYFSRFSPFRAIRDLRLYLSQRQPYELVFLVISIVLTTLLLAGFYVDSRVERVYKRDILYFDSWALDRSDEAIKAKQSVDQVERDRRLAEIRKAEEERKASFQRLDEKLQRWGL